MLTKTLFLVYVLIGCTFAVTPGKSTAGTEFVLGFPHHSWGTNAENGFVYVTTEEAMTTATVSYPFGKKSETSTKTILRYQSAAFSFPSDIFLKKTGIYGLITVNSTAPVRVTAVAQKGVVMDVFRITPKDSCYKSYYVTTPKGYPFIMVMTFSDPAKLDIKFPDYKNSFKQPCKADEECAPKTSVTVTLGAYKMWYFTLDGEKADLQNTLINSNVPVNVIAGSRICEVILASTDICISSIKPTQGWGKTYFVPNFVPTMSKIMRVNSKSFPLELKAISASSETLKIKSHEEYITFDSKTYVVTSSVPFGLYMLTFSNKDSGRFVYDSAQINLIPLEQWMNGLWAIPGIPVQSYQVVSYCLIAYDKPDAIKMGNGAKIDWQKQPMEFEKKKFYFSLVNLYRETTSIYSTTPGVKLMMYVVGAGTFNTYFGYPYEYYISSIHQSDCETVKAVDSDGIDNDCDGLVDEEVLNGKDDDGDKRIDEDFVVHASDGGKWSAWFEACTSSCTKSSNGKVTKFQRSCSIPSRFSKYCAGLDTKCLPRDNCPCDSTKVKWQCNCSTGCTTCLKAKTGFAICQQCKDDVQLSPDCSTPCPKGRRGIACSVVGDVDADGGGSLLPIIIGVVIGLLLLGAVLYFFVLRKKKPGEKEAKKDSDGMKEDSVGMAEEEHEEAIDGTATDDHLNDGDEAESQRHGSQRQGSQRQGSQRDSSAAPAGSAEDVAERNTVTGTHASIHSTHEDETPS